MKAKLFPILLSLFIMATITLMGCSSKFTFTSLINQGVLPVSTENAFLGTNLFLSKELENSYYLYNFFQSKGAPKAIQITLRTNNSNPELWLYYPKERESYIATLLNIENKYEWIVRGPFSLKRLDYKAVTSIAAKNKGAPVFYLKGSEHRFVKPSPKVTVAKVLSPQVPVVKKRVFRKKIKKNKKPSTKHDKSHNKKGEQDEKQLDPTTPVIDNFVPLNTDQQAILISQGYAERAYNGDILHLVTTPSESLDSITEWYTASKKNVEEIKKINHIVNDELQPGQKIRIPLKMIKNLKAMPVSSTTLSTTESKPYISPDQIESHIPKEKLSVTPKLPETHGATKGATTHEADKANSKNKLVSEHSSPEHATEPTTENTHAKPDVVHHAEPAHQPETTHKEMPAAHH